MWALLLVLLALPARADDWALDPSTGSFRVLILKEGALKALGHDHVLSAKDYRGRVALSDSSATLHLEINAAGLDIDTPEARKAEGVEGEVSSGDQEKIRRTMRSEKVLDVRRYPLITLDSTSLEPAPMVKDMWMLSGNFSLHGSSQTLDFPVTLTPREGGYWVSGYVRIRPSEYGIKPVKAIGGLIRTADEAMVRFTLALKRYGS
jgi:polyisoprenoid-binding protein YceI